MKILVTGLRGFTGRYLREELLAHGHEAVGLQANLLEPAAVMSELAAVQPQSVIHLAGIAYVGHGRADDFYRVNLMGSRTLLAGLAALPRRPASVVLASSANVYGNALSGQLDESAPLDPVNDYAVSKAAMEMMARLWAKKLPLAIARPFNYTGAGQAGNFLIPKIVEHFQRRADSIDLGNLHIARDFSDVRDVVRAYRLLAELAPAGETVNICSGRMVSLMEVLAMARTITGHDMQVEMNSTFVRSNEVEVLYGNAAHLDRLIGGWRPRPFEETLKWMLDAAI